MRSFRLSTSSIVHVTLGSLLALGCFGAAAAPPLTIDAKGVVLRDGNPYRGIGINYFSAFKRAMADPNDTSYREGFDVLVKHNIPFIRFMCGGFWPVDWKVYQKDKDTFFASLDAFVKTAEEKKIGLIPSLCWYDDGIPDLVDEPRSAWGNPESKTIAFMREYVQEVVRRYADSPAIWAWELGNEYSLGADLPNADTHRPPVHPTLGTRKERTAADDLTHDMVVTACREFGKAVRAVDPQRPITTGHSLPRSSAEHQRKEKSWGQDSKEEMVKNLIDVTPDPVNLISVHVYPFDEQKRFGKDTTSYGEILDLCMEAAAKSRKGLFMGEFGASDTEKDGGPEAARKNNERVFAAIEQSGVPLAALWVFDLSDQDSFINVTPTNHRAYLLDAIDEANRRLSPPH